jgi:hypothetical protein
VSMTSVAWIKSTSHVDQRAPFQEGELFLWSFHHEITATLSFG